MRQERLQSIGGEVMLGLPAGILARLGLCAGCPVNQSVEGGRLMVAPASGNRPRFTLEELLAQCDASAEITPSEQEWFSSPPTGSELV